MLIELRKARQKKKIPVKKMLEIIGSKYDITYFRKEQGKAPFTLKEAYAISQKYKIPLKFFIPED